MKIKKYILMSLVTTLIAVTGCDDFLEEEQRHLISDDVVFTSEETTIPAILGLYEGLAGKNMPSGANYHFMLASDLMHHSRLNSSTLLFTSTEENLSDFYSDRYKIIARTNEIIAALLETPFEGSTAFIGEAKFVRAYLYFDMARLFGGVPLITEKPEDYFDPEVLNVPRNTEEEIYNQVISDLLEAIEVLPNANIAGRPTADAARALLARVQLYRASIMQRDGTGDGLALYQEVVALCDEIIESDRNDLAPFYHAIFHPKFEGIENSEVLFKINQEFGDGRLSDHSYNGIAPDNGGQFGGGSGGLFRITYKAFTNYSRGDSVRRMKNMLRTRYRANTRWLFGGQGDFSSIEYLRYLPDIGTYKTGGQPDSTKALRAQTEGLGPFNITLRVTPNKFNNYPLADPNVEANGTAVDIPVLRLGEVYLMMAEALNEVNRDPSIAGPSGKNAFDYVNALRKRACTAFSDGGDYVAMNGNAWAEVPGAVSDWGPGDYGEDWFGNPFFTNRVQSADDDNNLTYWVYGGEYEAFRNEVIWERARELFMEQGTRFYDMVRRGNTAIDEVFMVNNLPGMYVDGSGNPQRYDVNAWQAEQGIERFANVNNFKLPIPLEQINNNTALVQNAGY